MQGDLPKVEPVEWVSALYRVLLGRDPDPEGLAEKIRLLVAGDLTADQVIAGFLVSEEYRQQCAPPQGQAAPRPFFDEVSQYGEVGRLLRRWVNEGARHRIVVDVGARGRERSNSYDLLRHFGWRGLLVEANPHLIDAIAQQFAGLKIELLQCAVSDYAGRATLHLGTNDDVSSLTEAAASAWGATTGAVEVEVRRLGELLQARRVPLDFDLLSLDIEGEDIKALNDTVDTYGYRPRWIIIEASYNFETKALSDLPVSPAVRDGYALVDQTEANLILRAV